jgi:glycosyltransferase involved in cell wall biosynthesis
MSTHSQLRILFVTNMYPAPARPIHGTFVAEQAASLRRRGAAVDVLFVDGPADRMNYLRGIGELHTMLRTRSYDLIHAHYVFSGLIARTQWRLPIVLTHHGIEAQQGWTAPLCRLTSRLVDRTIATSPAVARGLGLPGVTVVPCGVDTDLFAPLPAAVARMRLGLPSDAPLILFAGTPRPEKRLPLIQAAVGRLREQRPEVQLILAHTEPRERMALYMNACDVLALASVAEGSPMVVREAMACNLPVVSTDVGDVAALFDGLPGHYLAAADADDLAARLAAALAFGGRTAGRERILPWSLDAVAARLETIYHEAAAKAQGMVEPARS